MVGVVLAATSLLLLVADDRLRDTSNDVRQMATITTVTRSWGGASGPTVTVDFSFVAPDGTHRVDRFSARPSTRYVVGGLIDIAYPVGHPDQAFVLGETRDAGPVPWFFPMLFGIGAFAVGLAALRRLRWISRTLRDNPWVLAGASVVERPVRMLHLSGAPEDGTVLAQPLSWRGRTLDPFAPQAWVAGSGRRFLVAVPGGSDVLRFRRIRLVADPLSAFDPSRLRSRLVDERSSPDDPDRRG
ncbi:MAG: hypothetical protein JWN62_2448 [Acidimicrobiales bacterium]|nr:hypothetical protein [Acidimicrobiales bacterium]